MVTALARLVIMGTLLARVLAVLMVRLALCQPLKDVVTALLALVVGRITGILAQLAIPIVRVTMTTNALQATPAFQ
jgi:hypothetical protein